MLSIPAGDVRGSGETVVLLSALGRAASDYNELVESLNAAGYLAAASEEIVALTRDALLQVDILLPAFFLRQHMGIRYT